MDEGSRGPGSPANTSDRAVAPNAAGGPIDDPAFGPNAGGSEKARVKLKANVRRKSGRANSVSMARMQAELTTAPAWSDSLETERAALASGFHVTEEAVARSGDPEEALKALGAELGDALAEYGVAELRIEQLADALTQLQLVAEAAEARARQSDAAAEVHLARNEAIEARDLLEQKAGEWNAERAALAGERDRLAAERRGMATQQDRLAAALIDLAARIRTSEQHAGAQSAELAKVSAQRAHLLVERTELERRATRLAERCSRADRQIFLLEKGREAADERTRRLQIELTRVLERLRVEQDDFARSRDEFTRSRDELARSRDDFARSTAWLAEALSDLGGRLTAAEQQADAAAERAARIEQHAAWADAQIAQLVEREMGLRATAARITGRQVSDATDALELLEVLHRRQRELERELDRECAVRERLAARLAEWEGSRCAVVAASCCRAWRAMIGALCRAPQAMGKIVGR